MLWSSLKNRRCSACFGPVRLRHVEGRWVMDCYNGCEPFGHVSAAYAERQLAKDAEEFERVAAVYPEYDPREREPVEFDETVETLYGKE